MSQVQIYELVKYKSITRSVCYQSKFRVSSIIKTEIRYVCIFYMNQNVVSNSISLKITNVWEVFRKLTKKVQNTKGTLL